MIFSFYNSVSKCREATQCAGREITLNCSSPDWLIEVENELYGYNESRACDVSADTCTGVEFLDPPSIKHCNGKPSCSFNVPTDTHLSVCRENATSLKVIYQCVASKFSSHSKVKGQGPGVNSNQSKNVGKILLSMQLSHLGIYFENVWLGFCDNKF